MREFSSFVLGSVYIHLKANVTMAVERHSKTLCDIKVKFPNCLIVVVGDFSHINLWTELPWYKQQADVKTKGEATLDHCYCMIKGHTPSFSQSLQPCHGLSDALLTPASQVSHATGEGRQVLEPEGYK